MLHSLNELSGNHQIDVRFLNQVPIFSELDENELYLLKDICHYRTSVPDEIIYDEGQLAVAAYIIKAGSVGLYRHITDNPPERVHCLYAGDSFGESALFLENKRPYQAKALEKTTLFAIYRPEFENLILKKPQIGIKILRQILQRQAMQLLDREKELQELSEKLLQAKIVV